MATVYCESAMCENNFNGTCRRDCVNITNITICEDYTPLLAKDYPHEDFLEKVYNYAWKTGFAHRAQDFEEAKKNNFEQ